MAVPLPEFTAIAKLSSRRWKQKLASNEGIFKHAERSPGYVIGPTLDSQGRITGDMMVMEEEYFQSVASREQQQFLKVLQRVDVVRAKEYLLTISGSLEIWKRDVRWLKIALRYLQEEEKFLEEEAALFKREGKHFPGILKRHFPQLFQDIEFPQLSLNELNAWIKTMLDERIRPEEEYLKHYLHKIEAEMPFLWD